jgi:histidinol-phosphate aminotransferase
MTITPRPEIMTTPYDQHGAFDYAELEALGLSPDEIIDFSVNINPFGPSPKVKEALQNMVLDRYPDRESLALRRALANKLDTIPEQIVIGNGTAELLWLLATAFIQPGDKALILGPTFGEYTRSVSLFGGKTTIIQAKPESEFHVEAELVEKTLSKIQPKLVFICTPNNPTGTVIRPRNIQSWANSHPNTLFIIDEAYHHFAPGFVSCLSLNLPNVVILRSMTKDYAIAGLRLGYAAGHTKIIDALARVRSPWNVNAAAQIAGLAALNDNDHLQKTLGKLQQTKIEFITGLNKLGLHPLPSQTHYMMLDVGNATDFRRKLLSYGIQVRDCTSFGWPQYIRISTRTPDENAQLLAALKEILS